LRTLVNGEVISNNLIELKLSSTYEIKTLDIYDVHHLIHFEDIERNRIVLEGKGIYISHKLSKSLNIEQGDTITWRLLGASDFIDSEIVGIVRTPVGQGFIMNGEYAASVNVNYQITSIFTTETEIDESLNIISNIQSKSDLKNSLDTILETLQVIIYIMIIGALILGLVVLYNLGVISFTERFRELSTLKVLGFQDKQINQLIISQNIWLTIIGIIIGLPLGKMLVKIIFELTPENIDYRISISLLSYIICILGTLTVSIIVNLMLFKKTSQIDMVSSLKISE
jgi:putative ABC transport system permease protein